MEDNKVVVTKEGVAELQKEYVLIAVFIIQKLLCLFFYRQYFRPELFFPR